MASTYEAKIVLSVDSQTGIQNIKIIKDEMKKLGSETTKAASGFAQANDSLLKSASKFATTFLGVGSAIYAVSSFMRNSIETATTYQTKMIGLQILAGNLGYSIESVNTALQDLTKEGMLSQVDAVQILTYTLQGYVGSIDMAIKVNRAFKDLAAVGGETTLSYSERVRGLAESYLTLMSRIGDKRGLAENWNRIIEVGENLTKKRYEAENLLGQRMIINTGVLAVSGRATGGLNALMGTNVGIIEQARAGMKDLSLQTGNALIPAIAYLASAFNSASSTGKAFAEVMKAIGVILVGVEFAAIALSTALWKVYQTAYSVSTLQFGKVGDIWKGTMEDLTVTAADAQTKIEEIWSGKGGVGWGDLFGKQNQDLMDMLNQMPASAAKAAKKATEEIAKENDEYARKVAKRDSDYKRSLAELVWAHQEKRDSLIADLDEENRAYEKSNAQRLADFNKTIAEMEKDHLRSVRDYNQDLADEDAGHAKRVRDLEQDIAAEKAKGLYIYGVWNSASNAQRLADLEQELADENEAYAKRAAQIKQSIADELIDYEAALAEKRQNFQEETLTAQEEHQKRITSLQTELNTENELLAAHAVEVAMVKDQMKEDDIARQVRQHAEEVAEDERQHQLTLANSIKNAEETGAGYGSTLNKTVEPYLYKFEDGVIQCTKNTTKKVGEEGKNAGLEWVGKFVAGVVSKAKDLLAKNPFAQPLSIGGIGLGDLINLKFQHGGIVPGPIGAPVPAIVHGGERIVPKGGSEVARRSMVGGGGATVNIYGNLTVDTEDRVKQLAEMISRMLGRESELSRYGVGY